MKDLTTVSAWHPDVLRRLPRTSPDSVGMSRPQLQPSSRDPSSKSRCFACSLTVLGPTQVRGCLPNAARVVWNENAVV
ncbi:hypothetical protein FD755_011630 [Muntiacus reevesi]|uniref:Uncharacterized protein n=1 Tax=Muntiacus reevesi TaxID=9886 RepID=A0A5N3XVK9_MUNRE|nr:hypothetical protein FD755_011630 [Muntiacus reevesi]